MKDRVHVSRSGDLTDNRLIATLGVHGSTLHSVSTRDELHTALDSPLWGEFSTATKTKREAQKYLRTVTLRRSRVNSVRNSSLHARNQHLFAGGGRPGLYIMQQEEAHLPSNPIRMSLSLSVFMNAGSIARATSRAASRSAYM